MGGDWRSTVFVDCGECCGCQASGGVLLATDRDGRPLLIPATVFQMMTGMAIDKTECLLVIERAAFEMLFATWLKWTADTPKECGLRQAVCRAGWTVPRNT